MKKNTKKRILDAALHLFNQDGYMNVRLYQIADEAKMSVGNMAYHYNHKPEILLAIFEQLQNEQQLLLDAIQGAPIFENFDLFLKSTFELQNRYLFFYLDTLELIRSSEELKEKYWAYLGTQELQIELILQMNKARGALHWEAEESSADFAKRLRRTIDSWHYMQQVEGQATTNFELFRTAVWTQLKPFFTKLGQKEFRQMQYELLS